MSQPCWSREDDYRYLEGADRAGIAWEFLRRNPDYRRAAMERSPPASQRRGSIELLGGARPALGWGLLFRRRTRRPGG